jgi:hypothetical protein
MCINVFTILIVDIYGVYYNNPIYVYNILTTSISDIRVFLFFFFEVLSFELMASHLLGKCSAQTGQRLRIFLP